MHIYAKNYEQSLSTKVQWYWHSASIEGWKPDEGTGKKVPAFVPFSCVTKCLARNNLRREWLLRASRRLFHYGGEGTEVGRSWTDHLAFPIRKQGLNRKYGWLESSQGLFPDTHFLQLHSASSGFHNLPTRAARWGPSGNHLSLWDTFHTQSTPYGDDQMVSVLFCFVLYCCCFLFVVEVTHRILQWRKCSFQQMVYTGYEHAKEPYLPLSNAKYKS